MNRRDFLKNTSGATALLSCFPASLSALERVQEPGELERRALGKTGENLSILGFGGIVVMNATPREASQRVTHAIEAGVNYFDVAPSYGDAEDKLGPALKPYRSNVFLACKTAERGKAGAASELERSLRKMQTDHFDLYQLHAVTTLEEVDNLCTPWGVSGLSGSQKIWQDSILGLLSTFG